MSNVDRYVQVCYHTCMKLSAYAKQQGISYRTALRWFRAGIITGYQTTTGTIIVTVNEKTAHSERVAIYARVSSAENKVNLDSQAERLVAYCTAKGYQITKIVKEIGSGVNDSRPKLLALLEDQSIMLIVVEHKDRLSRFGVRYIDTLLHSQNRRIEIVNEAENDKEDLIADLVAIVYSFTARLYGQRRAKRKTEKIVQELQAKDGD